MTTFDPDQGVLRVRHAALAVLALLAADPTSSRLHDHGVADPLAELRAAGLVGASGLDPAAAPLAHAIGASHRTADLVASDHGAVRRARLWTGPEAPGGRDLTVLGLAAAEDPEAYELMADTPAQAPALVAELVGLGTAPPPPVEGRIGVQAAAFASLVAADERVTGEEVAEAAGAGDLARALTAALKGSGLRWRLSVTDGPELWVLDAGASGLWVAHREAGADTLQVGAATASEARASLAATLAG